MEKKLIISSMSRRRYGGREVLLGNFVKTFLEEFGVQNQMKKIHSEGDKIHKDAEPVRGDVYEITTNNQGDLAKANYLLEKLSGGGTSYLYVDLGKVTSFEQMIKLSEQNSRYAKRGVDDENISLYVISHGTYKDISMFIAITSTGGTISADGNLMAARQRDIYGCREVLPADMIETYGEVYGFETITNHSNRWSSEREHTLLERVFIQRDVDVMDKTMEFIGFEDKVRFQNSSVGKDVAISTKANYVFPPGTGKPQAFYTYTINIIKGSAQLRRGSILLREFRYVKEYLEEVKEIKNIEIYCYGASSIQFENVPHTYGNPPELLVPIINRYGKEAVAGLVNNNYWKMPSEQEFEAIKAFKGLRKVSRGRIK